MTVAVYIQLQEMAGPKAICYRSYLVATTVLRVA